MKIIITFFICIALNSMIGTAQQNEPLLIPRETLAIQLNTTTFLTGEYMYYSVQHTKSPAAVNFKGSTIAYVSLVAKDGTVVFNHKIALQNNFGHSDFFLPNALKSGSYKLLGFTNEMRSARTNQFVESDIFIINPYQANQKHILANEEPENHTAVTEHDNAVGFQPLTLVIDKKTIGTREKLNLFLQNSSAEKGYGTFSVSVRKIDALPKEENTKTSTLKNIDLNGLPAEVDGWILSGTLQTTSNYTPLANIGIAISVPGDDFLFEATQTDANGNFQFNMPVGIEGNQAFLQLIDASITDFEINIDSMSPIPVDQLNFAEYKIDVSVKKDLLSRSIANQIENAYFSEKPDTITARAAQKSFLYYEEGKRYNLEDYTRFKTLEETFTEFIPSVQVARNKQGIKEIRVFERKFGTPTDDLPLFFIDGLWVRDAETLLALDARTLETIKIVRRGYVYGGKEYFGVLLLTSKEPEKNKAELIAGMRSELLFKPEPQKTYYQQRYDATKQEHFDKIPDYRHQLLWLPRYKVNATRNHISFYSSDVPGVYEITVAGRNLANNQLVVKERFTVSEASE